ncbi:epithelial splicing regulatory protein 1-like [Dendronephthya gigantea]|uniref:epithelial splicing regulatory protein 1-like n=1 Tax=Dendronephthya gigantea TaxID=151771 RepID=UPI001069E8FF|nr:epithelial splicing regulatory protein 1-like [Dendronephthya gigantea]
MLDEDSPRMVIVACEPSQCDGDNFDRSFVLAYIVYDRAHDKTLASLERIIRPSASPERPDDLQNCASVESNDSDERNCSLEFWLQKLQVDVGEDPAIVVTYGPLALREFIHPRAQQEKLSVQDLLHSYVDVELNFKRKYPQQEGDELKNVHQVASHLGVENTSENPQGLEFCRVLLGVMQQMPPDGTIQMIQTQYSHLPSTNSLQEDTIAHVQGFSPNTTEFKLARFFAGLNIESGGIVLCPTVSHRQFGEAMVRFTNKEQRDLALNRSGMKFGSRIIEVSKASIQDYTRVMNQDYANGSPQGLNKFLHLAVNDSVIVRMRGLPYNTKASEIVTFFGEESPVFHEQQGVLFVYHPDGRPTGDAFVLFANAEHGKLALSKHRQTIGKRYVELFQMSKQEVIQVFTRHTIPNNGFSFSAIRGIRPAGVEPLNSVQNNAYLSNVRNIVRLRGLPYSASVQDILDFLDEFAKYVSPAGVHMVYNYQSRPTGDAFIELKSAEHAQKASESLHKKHIGERYIEVFQCSSSDMRLMLMSGITSNNRHPNAWLSASYSPRTPPHVPTAFTYPPAPSSPYPAVSSPQNVRHSSNSPLAIISVPSSPTVSPRVYMTSPGYMTYPSQSYNVFNFSYPPSNVPVDGNSVPHTPPVMSPTAYDSSAVFFTNPSYQQVPNDYAMTQMEPVYGVPISPYMPPSNGYYPSGSDTLPDTVHVPAYVETYSG